MIESIDGNIIKLPYGSIEIDVEQGGWSSNHYGKLEFTVDYNRPDLELYRYKTFPTLEEAFAWYHKQDLNMKGA